MSNLLGFRKSLEQTTIELYDVLYYLSDHLSVSGCCTLDLELKDVVELDEYIWYLGGNKLMLESAAGYTTIHEYHSYYREDGITYILLKESTREYPQLLILGDGELELG